MAQPQDPYSKLSPQQLDILQRAQMRNRRPNATGPDGRYYEAGPDYNLIRGPASAMLQEDPSAQVSYRAPVSDAVEAVRGFGRDTTLGRLLSGGPSGDVQPEPMPRQPVGEQLDQVFDPSFSGNTIRGPASSMLTEEPDTRIRDFLMSLIHRPGTKTEADIQGFAKQIADWLGPSSSAQARRGLASGVISTEPLPLTSSEERGTLPMQSTANLGPFNPLLGDPIIGGNQPQMQPQPQPLKPTNPSNVTGQHPPWVGQARGPFPPALNQQPQPQPRPFQYEPGGRAGTTGQKAMTKFGSNYAREEGEAQALAQPGGRPVFGTAPSGRPVFQAQRFSPLEPSKQGVDLGMGESNTARGLRSQLQQKETANAAEIERRRRLAAQGPQPADFGGILDMLHGGR